MELTVILQVFIVDAVTLKAFTKVVLRSYIFPTDAVRV